MQACTYVGAGIKSLSSVPTPQCVSPSHPLPLPCLISPSAPSHSFQVRMHRCRHVDIKSFSSVPTPQCVSPSPLPSLPLLPGLLGVSSSPSNCSSVDNNTNTCTVLATINSSLTLCADFVKYPEHAKRHAVPDLTIWKQELPSEENILSCYSSQCTSSAKTGYNFTEDWGRCLHVDRVVNNTLLSYSIVEVFPPKEYPPSSPGIVHRTVLFNIKGELPVCAQDHWWTRVLLCVDLSAPIF